jgi:lipopolysaccharide assembly LptE-like protein
MSSKIVIPCAILWIAVLLPLGGCAGYQIGNASLFPPDIHTVYVPIFESDSFRRNMGEQLTEAVSKEIERRTPFKVVGSPNADSILTGRIMTDTKHSIVREPNNEGRELEIGLVVKVSWADRHGVVVREGQVPVPPEMVDLGQTVNLVPEYGASSATAQQQAIVRMARKIVDLMESPW